MRKFVLGVAAGAAFLAAMNGAFAQPAAPPAGAAQYAAIKTVMQRLYDKGDREIKAILGKGDYDLYHCSSGSEYLGSTGGDEAMASLANIAFDVVIWSNNLKRLNYPAASWQTPIAQYEANEIALVQKGLAEAVTEWADRRGKFLNALSGRLAERRAKQPSLRKVVVEGGCGAGEVNVHIATEPKGGQVLFIPTFFYELCRVQNVDPDDTKGCTRWREAVEGTLAQVSGDYQYVVRWPDGAVRRGKLSFQNLQDGQTVTLRKP
jgi:hypothetical protein